MTWTSGKRFYDPDMGFTEGEVVDVTERGRPIRWDICWIQDKT